MNCLFFEQTIVISVQEASCYFASAVILANPTWRSFDDLRRYSHHGEND
jgi:hypothetical protein